MVDCRIWRDLLGWIRQSIRYLKLHVFVSTKVTRAFSFIVWLIAKQFVSLLFLILGLCLTAGRHVLGLGVHLFYLIITIVVLNFIKSIQPRYKFLFNYKPNRTVRRHKDGKPRSEKSAVANRVTKSHDEPVLTEDYQELVGVANGETRVTFKDALVKMYLKLADRWRYLNKCCSKAVTDGNIQSIYEQLTWSSTRPEFESVYWFNHTLQTLWPSVRTLTIKLLSKQLLSNKKSKHPARGTKSKSKKTRSKYTMIKESDIQRNKPKMSFYLSCRRQLELLHKNKERVMERGDEFLGRKAAMMIMYLIRKFILCSKQYFTDQICWLVTYISSKESQATSPNGARKLIELDLRKFFSRQHIKFNLDKRQTKSAGGAIGRRPPAKKRPKIRFRSAPDYGIPCNSRRIISSKHLMSFDGIRRIRDKRQKLARSINEIVQESRIDHEKRHNIKKPITVEAIDFGSKAPKITAIKYLEKEDNMLAESLVGYPPMATSDMNTMRLIVEVSFKNGRDFEIRLSSVPILDRVKLTKFRLRVRLLIAINHMTFVDHQNLEIFRALDSDQLLPIFNQLQVTLIDMPQLDWHIKRAKPPLSGNKLKSKRSAAAAAAAAAAAQSRIGDDNNNNNNKKRSKRSERKEKQITKNVLANLIRTPRSLLKRNLQPICLINNSYFKYIIHAAFYCLQKWFQHFDISIGEKFYIKTLW